MADLLNEIKESLKTIEAPWFRPDKSEPPENDVSGKCDKIIFGADSISTSFEGGGFLVRSK